MARTTAAFALLTPGLFRYAARVSYDGLAYSGWQKQSGDRAALVADAPSRRQMPPPSVQGQLEYALARRFAGRPYAPATFGASRTDAGVHAAGQVAHIDLGEAVDGDALALSLNALLPADVRVLAVAPAPDPTPAQVAAGHAWHAMHNARGKLYTYRLATGPVYDPLRRRTQAHVTHEPLDLEALRRALELFEGPNDFRAFANGMVKKEAALRGLGLLGPGCLMDTRRTVFSVRLVVERDDGPGGQEARVEVSLDGALYQMVRNVVGAAVAVARGRLNADAVRLALATGNRPSQHFVAAAPAHGLTLTEVYYDGGL